MLHRVLHHEVFPVVIEHFVRGRVISEKASIRLRFEPFVRLRVRFFPFMYRRRHYEFASHIFIFFEGGFVPSRRRIFVCVYTISKRKALKP
jgi:hypothetical protein